MTGTNTSTEAPPMLAPTAKQIDALVREYAEVQRGVDAYSAGMKVAQAQAAELKEQVIEMVQAYGFRHTEKSTRIEGLHTKATITIGTRTSIDTDAVEGLRTYLDKQDIPDLSARFFSTHVSYSLVAGPGEVLKTIDVATRIRTKVTALIALCFQIKTNAPSLKVEVVEAEKPATIGKAA